MSIQIITIEGKKYALLPLSELNALAGNGEDEYVLHEEVRGMVGVTDDEVELSVAQVADILGKHPNWIRYLIQKGRLKAYKVGGRYKIKLSDLNEFRQGIPTFSKIV